MSKSSASFMKTELFESTVGKGQTILFDILDELEKINLTVSDLRNIFFSYDILHLSNVSNNNKKNIDGMETMLNSYITLLKEVELNLANASNDLKNDISLIISNERRRN